MKLIIVISAVLGVASAAPQYGYGAPVGGGYGAPAPGPYGGGGYGAPYGAYGGGAYDQGASQLGAVQGSNLGAYGAQGSQGSALNAAQAQGSQGSAGQYSGLGARNAGASSSQGQRFGSQSTYGESWDDRNAYDHSLAAQQGSASQGSQGSASQLGAAQGSQGSVNALNANQFGALNSANQYNNGAGYGGVVG